MDIEEINKLYENRINNMTTDFIDNLLSEINLFGCSLFNRVVITEQLNGDITDVRTYGDWELLGRKVSSYDRCIYIMESNTVKEYVDNSTGDVVDYSELTPEEMASALVYNLIHLEDRESEKKVSCAYRFEDTDIEKDNYIKIDRLNFKELTKAIQCIYDVDIQIGELNSYSNGVLSFDIKNPNDVIDFIIKFISDKECINDTELLECALKALIGIRKSISHSYISLEELEKIFKITDEIIYKSGKVSNSNRVSEIQLRRKSKMLGILRSTYIRENFCR